MAIRISDRDLEEFIQNWIASLDRNDQMALILCVHVLSKHAGLKAIFAANVAADLVGYSELYESGRVVSCCRWHFSGQPARMLLTRSTVAG